MSTKPQAIRKQDIIEVASFKYEGYEKQNYVPERFVKTRIVAKLKDKNKTPNFKNILDDVTLMFLLENNEGLLANNGWIELEVVLKV
jgi:hypothetical protein